MCAWQTSLHAVAQSQSVEQLALDISKRTPFEAITGVTPLMDALVMAQDVALEERAQMIFSLDEAAQIHARSYIERFLALSSDSVLERRSLWSLARGYWATVLDAYGELLSSLAADSQSLTNGALIAQVAVRTIRAGVLRSKWDAFGGGAMEPSVWTKFNDAYSLAIRSGADRLAVRPRVDRTTETTAEREYLRAVALLSIGLEQLDPLRVEVATSLVHYVLPLLEISDTPSSTSCYWVDVAQTMPPARLMTLPSNPVLPRYFCGAAATISLRDLLGLSASGELPPGLPLQMEGSGGMASVLSRMLRVWSNEVPTRRYRRLPMMGQMFVAEGLSRFVGKLLGDADETAVWDVCDASLQGLGVDMLGAEASRLRVGSLVGFKPTDGERWCVGAIRRLKRIGWSEFASHDRAVVGIEKLGTAPEAVVADDGAQSHVVLLLEPLQKGLPLKVLVPVPGPLANQPLYLRGGAKTIKLTPLDTLEHGVDFAVRTYIHAP